MKKQRRILIIDANNRFLSCFVKTPTISSTGQPIGGVDGFLKSLGKMMRETQPDKVLVCWDSIDGTNKRKQVDENYKAHRKRASLNRMADNLTEEEKVENQIWQQLKLIELLNWLPISQLHFDNLEADDVIAFVATTFTNDQKIIVSADKDFYQLLDETTLAMRPTQRELLSKYDIIEKFGIHPNNMAVARAIAGDQSDNLPGVFRVGLKTVASSFDNMDQPEQISLDKIFTICENEKVKKGVKQVYRKILEAKENVIHNHMMMQLEVTNISLQNQRKIRNVVETIDIGFNQTDLMLELFKCGLGDNYTSLFRECRKLVNRNRSFLSS